MSNSSYSYRGRDWEIFLWIEHEIPVIFSLWRHIKNFVLRSTKVALGMK
jgi:hypothetical protein